MELFAEPYVISKDASTILIWVIPVVIVKNVKYLSDQWKCIERYVKNRDVLDIGAVAHTSTMAEKENWLHGKIRKVANYVVGVDIAKEEVEILRKKGYNIIYGNAETVNLNRTFDVVVIGDTIAQVDNQGLLLDNMYRHLINGGVLIITTPNLLCWWVLRDMFLKKSGFIDANHLINYHDVNTLTHLLNRHNFRVIEIYYTDSGNHLICKYFPILSDTIVIVGKKDG